MNPTKSQFEDRQDCPCDIYKNKQTGWVVLPIPSGIDVATAFQAARGVGLSAVRDGIRRRFRFSIFTSISITIAGDALYQPDRRFAVRLFARLPAVRQVCRLCGSALRLGGEAVLGGAEDFP